MSLENQETITFSEFRAWLTGLIRGKNGVLPDLDDWKLIKEMMDKVSENPIIITTPAQPNYPLSDPWNERPWAVPQGPNDVPNTGTPPYQPPVIWCDGQSKTYGELKDVQISVTNEVSGETVEQAFQEFFTAHEALNRT